MLIAPLAGAVADLLSPETFADGFGPALVTAAAVSALGVRSRVGVAQRSEQHGPGAAARASAL